MPPSGPTDGPDETAPDRVIDRTADREPSASGRADRPGVGGAVAADPTIPSAGPPADAPPAWVTRVADRLAAWPPLRQAEREARIWVRTWKGAAVNGLLTPLLFLGAMGLGLGGLIDDNAGGRSVDGLAYLTFVTPGILAAAALQSAAGDALWPVMSGIKWTKTFHAAAATPLGPGDVLGGYLIWSAARLTLNSVAFLAIAAVLGGVPSWWGLLAIPAAVAGGMALSAPLAAYTSRQDSDLSFPIIMRIVVMPMFLFSGTFFAVDQLPAVLRPVAWVTPLFHAVELCRGFTTGQVDALAVVGHTAFLAACIAGGWWLGAREFARRLGS